MKKNRILLFTSGAVVVCLLGFIISANPLPFSMARALGASQSCAKIVFGTTGNSTTTTAISDTSKFTASGINVTSVSSTKANCTNLGEAAKFGSSSAGGSLTFNFDALTITSIRLYGFAYSSSESTIVTLTSSSYTGQDITVSDTTAPSLDDLSGTNIYLYTGIDRGSGASSASLTITSSKRFYLAKILFTVSGSSAPTSSVVSSSPSSTSQPTGLSKSITSSNSTVVNTYSTGNYGTVSIDSTTYGFYRATRPSGTAAKLLPSTYPNAVAGSFYNTDSIDQITGISLTYLTASSSDVNAKLYYGNSSLLSSYYSLAGSSSSSTQNFTFPASSAIGFFRLDCGDSALTISSLTITYLNGTAGIVEKAASGAGLYRINPVVYSGSLTSGVSSVNIPQTLSISGSSYSVSTSKKYTYYTYSAVENDPTLASAAAYTDPQDVAAYFIAFHEYPANYVSSGNYSAASSLFGDAARCVSSYTRTDGYVNAVPYKASGSSIATYYECDIALDSSYSSSSRGVGRVVVFTGGFDTGKGATSYDSSYTAVFTDDHYATFQEYYNYGGIFSHRFDAEKTRTFYDYGAPTTLSKA